jgi:hypothetical protein
MLSLAWILTLFSLIAPGHTHSYGDGWSITLNSDGTVLELVKLLVATGLLALCIAILKKVTGRYIDSRRAAMHDRALDETGTARGFPVIPLPTERGPGQ